MRASLGGLLVALGCLTFAQAAHNVMVDHSETSQLTYLPASAWVEVELEAGDSTVDQHNRTATMASTPGAQVSLEFEGTAIYWMGYGTSNSSQSVEIIMDDATVTADVPSAEFGATNGSVAFFRPNLRTDRLHKITVRVVENDDISAVLYHVGFIYTIPDWGSTQSPIGMHSTGATLDSQPIATPTTSRAEQTSSPNKRNQVIAIIVLMVLVGLALLVGGLVLFAHRRRWKVDAERSSKPYNTLDGEEGRIGMLEASIVRARCKRLEHSVSPPGCQTPAAPSMEQGTLVGGGVLQNPGEPRPACESRSRTRMETLRLTITVPQSTNQLAKKRLLLESILFPKTALPPYPGSPLTRQ